MKARISQHMSWEPKEFDPPGSPMELATHVVWTWKVEVWGDDQDPPWMGDESWGMCDRGEIPVTWIPNAGETIGLGYDE